MTQPQTDNGKVSVEAIRYHAESIARNYKLSEDVRGAILEVIEGLGKIYGNNIDRMEALKLISHHIEVTKTGMLREPVGIEEFVCSPDYMNQAKYVRPRILEHLIELHKPDKYYLEVVLGGAIGIGKNYFADMSLAYDLYRLSCLYSPQAYYGLAPGSNIVFIHQSKTLNLAKKVVFQQFSERLRMSGYFPKNFQPNPQFRTELQFPHQIMVHPVSGTDTAALGMSVYGAVIDELNFMERIKSSRLTRYTGEQEYDQAEKLYTTILRRMESRFATLGRVPGKIYLISSANYKGDFIDRKEKEAATNPHIYVMHLAQWEALPENKFTGTKFYIRLPTDKLPGRILESEPEVVTKDMIPVPTEYKSDFRRDFIAALRDIGGVAVERRNKFIDDNFIEASFKLYQTIYGNEQIFRRPVISLTAISNLESLLNIDFLRRLNPHGPFQCHIDLSLSADSAGIAIGHVIGSKDIGSRTILEKETGNLIQESQGELPIYGVPGICKISPEEGEEIDLNILREIVVLIGRYIRIRWVTADRFQYASILQFFRRKKMQTSLLSLDRSPDGYLETKFAIREQRVFLTPHENLRTEFSFLEQDFSTGKIDHPAGGSKDLTDSVAGVVYALSDKRSSYRVHGNPMVLGPTAPIPRHLRRRQSDRPSTGRERLY